MNDYAPNGHSLLDRLDLALTASHKWLYVLFALSFLLKLIYIVQSADALKIGRAHV